MREEPWFEAIARTTGHTNVRFVLSHFSQMLSQSLTKAIRTKGTRYGSWLVKPQSYGDPEHFHSHLHQVTKYCGSHISRTHSYLLTSSHFLANLASCSFYSSLRNPSLPAVLNPIPTLRLAAPILLYLVNVSYFLVASKDDFHSSDVLIAGHFLKNIFGEATRSSAKISSHSSLSSPRSGF
jgi:hypothetical protein